MSNPVPLLVVYDGPADGARRPGGLGSGRRRRARGASEPSWCRRSLTEFRRYRRTALERLVSAHLLVDVLAWESGYVLLDPSGLVVESALQSGEPWFGGLTGLRAADLVLPSDVERFESARRLAQQVPSVARTVEVEVVSPGPDRRWLEVTLVNVSSVSPLDGVVAIHRDVAGRSGTATSDPAARSEPTVDGGTGIDSPVLALLSEGVLVYGPDGTVTSWNGAAARLLGTPAAAALGADVQDLVPHVPPPAPGQEAGCDVWSDEMRTILADGSEQVLERTFTRMWGDSGVLRATALVVSSATQDRVAAATSRRFEAILDSSSEAILSKTTDGHHHHLERGRDPDVRLLGRGGDRPPRLDAGARGPPSRTGRRSCTG